MLLLYTTGYWVTSQLGCHNMCIIRSERMSNRDLAFNLLAKSYAVEFLKIIDIASKQLCPGCTGEFHESRYHVVCLANLEDKLFYCSDILPDMISESDVSEHVLRYIAQLGFDYARMSAFVFNIAQRRRLLDNPIFWLVISEYAAGASFTSS